VDGAQRGAEAPRQLGQAVLLIRVEQQGRRLHDPGPRHLCS
jgi:hypothetical protein